mgnify:CR=1 FL=1
MKMFAGIFAYGAIVLLAIIIMLQEHYKYKKKLNKLQKGKMNE